MPVFADSESALRRLAPLPFRNEKELQRSFERNLVELLGVKFVASEFRTGEKHGGRVDTLGLDEAGNPVIVEYKWGSSDSVINQGLFYLDWLVDHRGDFAMEARRALGEVEISWQAPRLIIVASDYTKYDTYAVNRLSTNIQLLRYQRYEGDLLFLDNLTESFGTPWYSASAAAKVTPTPVAPGEAEYDLAYHVNQTQDAARAAFEIIRERILALEGVEERINQKSQITYRTTRSFAAFSFRRTAIDCLIKGGDTLEDPGGLAQDIAPRGWGYRWMCRLTSVDDVDAVFALVRSAYEYER